MNEAPIYINPDQMFGYTKHLFLCDECNKWVFGMSKDPFDEGSYVSDEEATCPHEANWSGLKVMLSIKCSHGKKVNNFQRSLVLTTMKNLNQNSVT